MRDDREASVLHACPVQGVINIISKKWALLIVAVTGSYGRLRYGQLMEQLRGISPKTLADTLKDLERVGIIKRDAFNEIPPRVEYSLTSDGQMLRDAVLPLLKWAVDRSEEKECVILKAVLNQRSSDYTGIE
ncbi:MAG: winged helix-turn-helix transcriptional regulator [Nitrososphaerales archaeon]